MPFQSKDLTKKSFALWDDDDEVGVNDPVGRRAREGLSGRRAKTGTKPSAEPASDASSSSSAEEREGSHLLELTVNRKFARDYEERKQREELRRHHAVAADDSEDGGGDSDDAASTSSSEDEDGHLLTAQLDVQVLRTLNAIRHRDNRIYDPQERFFDDGGDDGGEEGDRESDLDGNTVQKKTVKPKRYKDVVREQVLQQMRRQDQNEADEDDEDSRSDTGGRGRPASRLAYDAQQRGLRSAFLEAASEALDDATNGAESRGEGGDEEGWMTLKRQSDAAAAASKTSPDEEAAALRQFDEEMRRFEVSIQRRRMGETPPTDHTELVDPKGEVADGEAFLMEYFKNRKWMEREHSSSSEDDGDSKSDDGDGDGGNKPDSKRFDTDQPKNGSAVNDDGNDSDGSDDSASRGVDDESLHELDRADDFEARYNFRFEQPEAASASFAASPTSGADASLVRYSRGHDVPTFRRPDTTRQERRKARKERKEAERRAQEEQLRRLKNAKRQELERKLHQVKAVLGQVGQGRDSSEAALAPAIDEAVILKLLEGDFDPEKFERLMKDAYGDDFYEKPDAEWKTDKDVRDTLLKTEEDGALLVGQDDEDGGLYDNADDDGYDEAGEEEEGYEEEEEWPEELEEFAQEEGETDLERKVKSKLMDELYKLDYEDIVAGQPTRFKYRKVQPNSFGLSAEEILLARDSTLKQFVSLKKIAPYRDDEYFVGSRKRRRFRELLKQDLEEELRGDSRPNTQSETSKEGDEAGPDAADKDDSNAAEELATESKKRKKNRRLKRSKKRHTDEPDGADHGAVKPNLPPPPYANHIPAADASKESSRDEMNVQHMESSLTKANSQVNSAASPVTDEAECAEHPEAKRKRQRSHKKKNKKVKTKPFVEGVSEARLASYGL